MCYLSGRLSVVRIPYHTDPQGEVVAVVGAETQEGVEEEEGVGKGAVEDIPMLDG